MRPRILWITEKGKALAQRLSGLLLGEVRRFERGLVEEAFQSKRPLIFIGAVGIATRAVAPFIRHKSLDPPVVVLDEGGRFVISLLSGHLGGANELARKIAGLIGATPVITTASEVRGLPALDLWLRANEAVITDWEAVRRLQGKLLNQGSLKVFVTPPLRIKPPSPMEETGDPQKADLILSFRREPGLKNVFLVKKIALGLGFHDQEKDLHSKVKEILRKAGLAQEAVRVVATLKERGKNPGLLTLAREFGAEIRLFPREELSQLKPPSPSYARKALNLPGVAEPSALLGANLGPLILPKTVFEGVTLAAALCKLERPPVGQRGMEVGIWSSEGGE